MNHLGFFPANPAYILIIKIIWAVIFWCMIKKIFPPQKYLSIMLMFLQNFKLKLT